ncbi:MAG TPA: FUSC family protein, partial [Gemmatimonadales bacterium]|nr:FUSC family protein [Gemmatimonadales bacterium]
EALDSRLIAVALGTALMAAADRWLWPSLDPEPYERRLALTADSLERYLSRIRPLMDGSSVAESSLTEAREDVLRTALAWAPWALPPEQRPSSPFRHDRALLACAGLLRMLVRRTRAVEGALRSPDAPTGPRRGAYVLDAVHEAVVACGVALSGAQPPPDVEPLRAANRQHADQRLSRLHDVVQAEALIDARLRLGSDLSELGESADLVVQSVRAVRDAPTPSPEPAGELGSLSSPLWFVGESTLALSLQRARGHFTPRSVVFQNAVRLALGLAVARYLAGSIDLSHGSWVLLATLTLMRTTASATRSAMWPAFLGTLAGALLTGGLLLVFGQEPDVFTVLMPIAFFASFSLGPLAGPFVGPAAGQFFMTLAVAALFVQVAPATWQLAEARLIDVVLGGVVGSLVGLLVWPRGGSGEITRAVANTLHSASEHILTTTRFLTGSERSQLESTFRRTLQEFQLAGESLTQSMTEAGGERNGERWEAFVRAGQRILHGSYVLYRNYRDPRPLPWQDMTAILHNLGGATAQAAEAVSEEVQRAGTGQLLAVPTRTDEIHGWLIAIVKGAEPTSDTLRVLDTRTWLLDVATDLSEIVGDPRDDIDPSHGQGPADKRKREF